MSEIKLVEPTLKYADDIWRFRQEILDANQSFSGCGSLRNCSSVEEWIRILSDMEKEETIPEGGVPSNTYLGVRLSDNKVVGIIDLRHHINHPILNVWGGHMGYFVRESERKKGYGKEMLRQNLENCKTRGIDNVLITCDGDNIASEKTIIANGGLFETEIYVDGDRMKRYWINIR